MWKIKIRKKRWFSYLLILFVLFAISLYIHFCFIIHFQARFLLKDFSYQLEAYQQFTSPSIYSYGLERRIIDKPDNFLEFLYNIGWPPFLIWLVLSAIALGYVRYEQPVPVRIVPVPMQPEQKPKKIYPLRPRMSNSPYNYYGSANWSNPIDINHIYNDGIKNDLDTGSGYFIGAIFSLQPLMHSVTIAGSGQGKGVSLILPNLLRQPNSSWFVLDPKGENASISAEWQKKAGQKVVILDPWNEQKRLNAQHGIEAMGFNPLLFAKSIPDEMPEICGVIAEMLVPDRADSKDPYWESRARSLIKTHLLHLLTDRPEQEHHLGTLYEWLRLPTLERRKLWFEMEENTAYSVKQGISEFSGLSETEGPLPSILSVAWDNTAFLESTALKASLAKNDFDAYDLTTGKTTVYLVLPERFLRSHARWLRIVVGTCLKACNYKPDKRVNFLLDEFALMGKMPDIQHAYAFARGQNIAVHTYVQSWGQLVEIYGEFGANTIMANARVKQFFGIFDLYTQNYLSQMLGDTTVKMILHSQSVTTGTSHTTSSGWSISKSSPPDNSQKSQTSNSTSGSFSDGTSSSNSFSASEQYTGRRLLTNDEIGKMNSIITFIDGNKFLIDRLPFWDSFFEAFKEGRAQYFPNTDEEWHLFYDQVMNELPRDKDLVTTFKPRAYGTLIPIKNGER
jgi:type IV secretion system protein VirD4